MFGIAEGRLEMIFEARNATDLLVHSAGPGAWFGHPAVLAGDVMTTSARTAVPTVALVILQQDLYRFLERQPQFNREFFSMLNYTRKVGQALLTEALTHTGVERLAHRLAYLAETGETGSDGQILHSQEELGRMLGLSPATVQRAIRRLKSEALIDTSYGSIRILNPHGLKRFVEQEV